jgi:prepilin-type N-terminal cleavage/methylation domain-containing protein
MNKRKIFEKGFTLVELLIVIALIAILSVAVLATINPIEQSNKAKDSSVQNDAAEIMNAYERYYANAQSYPWMKYGATKPTVESAMLLRSDTVGFGICNAGVFASEPTAVSSACSTTDTTPGLLIGTDELKSAFVGKDEFEPVRDASHIENALWLYKDAGSGGSVYVCYIPKSKSNREASTNKLYCLNSTGPVRSEEGPTCVAPSTTSDAWATPTLNGGVAMFKCVP